MQRTLASLILPIIAIEIIFKAHIVSGPIIWVAAKCFGAMLLPIALFAAWCWYWSKATEQPMAEAEALPKPVAKLASDVPEPALPVMATVEWGMSDYSRLHAEYVARLNAKDGGRW